MAGLGGCFDQFDLQGSSAVGVDLQGDRGWPELKKKQMQASGSCESSCQPAGFSAEDQNVAPRPAYQTRPVTP